MAAAAMEVHDVLAAESIHVYCMDCIRSHDVSLECTIAKSG